jgi:hypothetical protein
MRSSDPRCAACAISNCGTESHTVTKGLKTLSSRGGSVPRLGGSLSDSRTLRRYPFGVVIERALNARPEIRAPKQTALPSNCRDGGGFAHPVAVGMQRSGRR